MVRARTAAYARGWLRVRRLPCPVIVVGNLTVGGSGKTPLVIWVAARLRAAGFTPGVILRGHGGTAARGGAPHRVQPDSDAAVVGDEALLLCRRTGVPVAVCRSRWSAGRLLAQEGVDVIVADDGLQHLALAREAEIAVIDGERGLGNGYLLPAGPLREPPERLGRVDILVVNGDGRYRAGIAAGPLPRLAGPAAKALAGAFTMRLEGERLLALAGTATRALSSLAGQRVHAVAGIGHPQRFFTQLRAAGLEPIEHPFPDHHRFRAGEIVFDDELPVLMTEKDAVKCRALGGPNHWYLPVTASFSEAEAAELFGRLRRTVTSRHRS